jgi:UDP-N-acetylmuramoyl-L-alanyl-D-glutamate--2,6-diaminopimelate ligase
MTTLGDLLKGVQVQYLRGDQEIPVTGIACHSSQVTPGKVFVAIKGFAGDGNDHVDQAVKQGAVAVVSAKSPSPRYSRLPWVQVGDDRYTLSRMSANYFDVPGLDVKVIGITGTNGKTTVAALLKTIISLNQCCGLLGTLGGELTDSRVKTPLTTPEAVEIGTFMQQLHEKDCPYLVMEVSSVALKLHRVSHIPFVLAVFTNISGDHLDFHGGMDEYFASKLRLFRLLVPKGVAVINRDDDHGQEILARLGAVRTLTYGFDTGADVYPRESRFDLSGIRATVRTPEGSIPVRSRLLGRVNLYNLLAAIAAGVALGIPPDQIQRGIDIFSPPRGRLEVIHSGRFRVIIDYAHTDEALSSALKSLAEIKEGARLILVFGAGGDRDRSKRPRLGRAASRYADYLILTSDNPRSEDAGEIAREIAGGFEPDFTAFEYELDRRRAIGRGLESAGDGDIVIIAGKGHEDYQIFPDRTVHFDDTEVVQEFLEQADG